MMSSTSRSTSNSANQGGLALQKSRSAYSPRSKRSPSQSSRYPFRSYSVHLDDGSVYHGGDHDSGAWEDSEDNEDELFPGDEVVDVGRDGTPDEKDLDAPPLQKKTTTKSRRDPNIVWLPSFR